MSPQQPQAYLKIGDTLSLQMGYNDGANPPQPINIAGYGITLLIRTQDGTLTLATLAIGSGITIVDAVNGVFVAVYAATSGWSGNVAVQFRFVDTQTQVVTSDPLVIGMQGTI